MNVNRMSMSLVFALLLGITAWLEFVQLQGAAFGIGESFAPVSGGTITGTGSMAKLAAYGLLLLTALGILGLTLSALGAFMRKKFAAVFGLISSLAVLPMALLYGWLGVSANIANRCIMSIAPEQWAISALPFPMVFVTIWLSWRRSRELTARTVVDSLNSAQK